MPLHVDRRDAVAVLTLDDPERRNAISDELAAAIGETIHALEADETVSAIVLTGAPPAFCSGAPLTRLAGLSASGDQDPEEVKAIYAGFLTVRDCSLPTVAAVNGPAVGAGFNLAMCCDVRIVSPSARFDSRFAQIGIHPGGGHTWMTERAVGPQAAAAMVLFGERIDGEDAARIGLAWRCVPDEELVDTAVEFAARTARVPRDLLQRIKTSLGESAWRPNFDQAVAAEFERQRWSFEQGYLEQMTKKS